jgi:hypothetical protein
MDPSIRPGPAPAWARSEVVAASTIARSRYPGPVGELIAAELDVFAATGGHLEHDGLLARLIRHLVTAPHSRAGDRS